VTPRTPPPEAILAALDSWLDQNRIEQTAITERDWESLERCQAEKTILMARIDRLLLGRRWELEAVSSTVKSRVQQAVDQIGRQTRSSAERLIALEASMQAEQEESRRSLHQIQRVRDGYGQSLGETGASGGATWVGRS